MLVNDRLILCLELLCLFIIQPWLYLQHRLGQWLTHPFWSTVVFLVLFPLFIMATFISNLLGLFINHMVQHRATHTSSSSSNTDSFFRLSSSVSSSSTSTSFASSSSSTSIPTPRTTTSTATAATTRKSRMDSSSSSASSSPQDDFSYWIERCSICFDARLDLCLDYCRDQYCLHCFQRYVTEVVTSSWGLSVKKIKCPVCQIHIPQSEWSKYVPAHIVDLYNKFNRPFRSFTRCCPRCETEVTACEYTKSKSLFHQRDGYRANLIHEIIMDLLLSCKQHQQRQQQLQQKQEDHPHTDMYQLLKVYEMQDWRNSTLLALHQRTISTLLSFVKHHAQDASLTPKVYAVSRHILLLDMKSETWKRLQFSHISFFPNVACTKSSCQSNFCLQCGYEAHDNKTCEENMQQMIYDEKSSDTDPIRWKLEHSKRCPSCSILITRDEGCNKVDCSLCGYCFCWACKSAWSEKCGFYRCAVTGLTEKQDESSDIKTELGVPDMTFIQSKFSTHAH